MRIPEPARLDRCGTPSHYLQLVHVRRAAELDEKVELVVGDHLSGLPIADFRLPPESVRPRAHKILEPISRRALVKGVGEKLEALVHLIKQRQDEVANRVIAKIG